MFTRCPRCGSDSLVEIHLHKIGLSICSSCRTSVFPEKSRVALGRKLMPRALQLWRERLLKLPPLPSADEAPLCPEHATAMVRGKVLDFSGECWRSPCCDLLVLEPVDMIRFLEQLEGGASLPRKASKPKSAGPWAPLMSLVRLFVKEEDGGEEVDLGLAEAQYNIKLSAVLGKLGEEEAL